MALEWTTSTPPPRTDKIHAAVTNSSGPGVIVSACPTTHFPLGLLRVLCSGIIPTLHVLCYSVGKRGKVPIYTKQFSCPPRCLCILKQNESRCSLWHLLTPSWLTRNQRTQCWCAEAGIDYSRHGGGTCDIPCSGDETIECGSTYAFTMYELDREAPSPTPAPIPLATWGDDYVGCFADDAIDRVLGQIL